ncbi:MAG TPA: LytTR family DNA-binding domain-containing protein [Bacteroidales bacterium]|nr:LytTR family DNA-binding domain-containing protein [Bacteroidales bacterium]HNS46862.1 LytTR family DNA-binding domain-containing protein [Bacteroidales bacterium]
MNTPFKALIVDDEASAREILEKFLSGFPECRIVGKEADADSALKAVLFHHPDIIFLDIEMPFKNGFDLIREIRKYPIAPTIVFVTAYNEYAILAIKLAAFDYILKPIDPDELKQCIYKFLSEKGKMDVGQKLDNLIREVDHTFKLRFNIRTGYLMIEPNEIVYFVADGSYTDIVLLDEKRETISQSIGKLEETLTNQFFRINRSVIINLSYLRKINRHRNECILSAGGKEYLFSIPSKHIRLLDELKL